MRRSLLDNMDWRGEKDFSSLPFGEVDALILSVLIYQRFEDQDDYGRGKTIKELFPLLCPVPAELTTGFEPNRIRLWKKAASSRRFSSLVLSDFDIALSSKEKNEEQFAAAVFSSPSIPSVVIYRGTDESITGWKEDLNLGFEDEIPSERRALSFLLSPVLRSGDIIMGGHSKGATLAVYAALKADDDIFRRIKCVYSFDGPGLPESLARGERWNELVEKTSSYVPTNSIFGVLFNTIPDPKVVKADGVGVFQHDAFNWNLEKETFVFDKEISPLSRLHGESLRSFFASSTRKEREILVEVIYKVLGSVSEKNVFHIPLVIIEHLDLFTKGIASLTNEEKKVISKLLKTIRQSRREGYRKLREECSGSREKENMA